MNNQFSVELKKERRLKIWLIPAGFLFILFLWAAFGNKNPSAEHLAIGYTFMFYQVPLLNCVLLPVMLAIIASRLCDMEVKGQTFKLLYTLQNKGSFYDLKFVHELLYLILFALGEGIIFPLCGKLFHYTEALSFSLLLRHIGITFIVGLVVLAIQHFLSLMVRNQMLPLIVGLGGAFIGLFSLYFPPELSRFVLWSYFGAFQPFGMDYNEQTRAMSFYPVPFPALKFTLFFLSGILIYIVCRKFFLKKEV